MYRKHADFFKGFSNPRRIKLLKLLIATGPATVSALGEAFEQDPSTVSRYLNQLRRLGILNTKREGQIKYYWVDQEQLRSMFERFFDFLNQPDEELAKFVENDR